MTGGTPRRRGLRVAIAPGAVVAHRAALGARLLAHRLELGGGAEAIIGLALGEQLPRDLGVARELLRLEDDLAVPIEFKPAHAVDDRVDRFLGRARPIGVLDPKAKLAAVVLGVKPVK